MMVLYTKNFNENAYSQYKPVDSISPYLSVEPKAHLPILPFLTHDPHKVYMPNITQRYIVTVPQSNLEGFRRIPPKLNR